MSDKDNGGDAFPTIKQFGESGEYWQEQGPGMTLRDYFAAKGLQGLLADPNEVLEPDQSLESFADQIARGAYIYADAMIEARKK